MIGRHQPPSELRCVIRIDGALGEIDRQRRERTGNRLLESRISRHCCQDDPLDGIRAALVGHNTEANRCRLPGIDITAG